MPGVKMNGNLVLKWYPGIFSFFFYYMGQGDCCLIMCPNGECIMIDCGSSKHFPAETTSRIRAMIKRYSKDSKTIDHLILTHPDIDHYSSFGEVLNPAGFADTPVVKNVYFSIGGASTDPLKSYSRKRSMSTKNLLVGILKPETINQVFINQQAGFNMVTTWRRIAQGGAFVYQVPADTGLPGCSLTIAEGNYGGSKPWSVKIVASNVIPRTKSTEGTPSNSASICTLFTYGTHKALLVGDATNATTNYMTSNPEITGLIENVTLTNVSHHGSNFNSSNEIYLNLINPIYAIDSVQNNETRYNLPRQETNQRFIDNMNENLDRVDLPVPQLYNGWYRRNQRNIKWNNTRVNQATYLVNSNPLNWQNYNGKPNIKESNLAPDQVGYVLVEPNTGFILERFSSDLPFQSTGSPWYNPTIYQLPFGE